MATGGAPGPSGYHHVRRFRCRAAAARVGKFKAACGITTGQNAPHAERGRFHPGQMPDALQHFPHFRRSDRPIIPFQRPPKTDVDVQHMVDAVTEIDYLEVPKTMREQAGAKEQHYRQRHLHQDQSAAHQLVPAGKGRCLQTPRRVGARGIPGRIHAGQHDGKKTCAKREPQHRGVRRDVQHRPLAAGIEHGK